ncbi:DNA repair protein RecO [Iamia sp.]|uniref:DNA repair protein RecO n=1 Tax=Iamia sp. TaxID=2722710 RepID=UPI002B98AD5A|nr:DNA repair protein RecO [Iamia sp.]HXH57909.1 DNA repair protein RecO [Iamia sp.]
MAEPVGLYRDHAIVLRTYKLGEADRIVVLLTEAHGEIRAVAKGVRRTKSRFGARLEPPTHLAVQLYRGRGELDTVSQVETIDHFRALRTDLEGLGRALTMVEAVDQVALEREPNGQLYRLLLGALRTLAADPSPLVLAGFLWKLLALEGVAPMIDRCVVCGAEGPLVAFDLMEGGAVCRDDRRGQPLSPEALALLRDVLGGRLGAALAAPVTAATVEVDRLAVRAVEHHLERRLRSVGVLDST